MRRSKMEIVTHILNVCSGGANKTRIVYETNLNFKTAKSYIDMLMERGMIDTTRGQIVLYETTPAGSALLESLRQVQACIS